MLRFASIEGWIVKKRRFISALVGLALTVLTGGAIAKTDAVCDVTWRKADNPHIISGTVTIPANQTVCIEPGVIVQWADNSQLILAGQLIGTGTAAEHISFRYASAAPNRIQVMGTLDLQYADIGVISNINAGGSVICRNCFFGPLGQIEDTSSNVASLPTRFLQIEDSVFDSTESSTAQIFCASLNAILRNVSFRNNSFCFIGNSYVYYDNVSSHNLPVAGLSFNNYGYQPLYLNNITVTNSARAGLSFSNGNFEIGPNVVLQNNQYPVSGKGGLMPGSQVPATGNLNNWVEVGQANATRTIYAPVSVPYVVDSFSDIGGIRILPGAHFKARSTFHFNTERGRSACSGCRKRRS